MKFRLTNLELNLNETLDELEYQALQERLYNAINALDIELKSGKSISGMALKTHDDLIDQWLNSLRVK